MSASREYPIKHMSAAAGQQEHRHHWEKHRVSPFRAIDALGLTSFDKTHDLMAAAAEEKNQSRRDHLLEFLARNLLGSRHGAPLAQGATGATGGQGIKEAKRTLVVVWPGGRGARCK